MAAALGLTLETVLTHHKLFGLTTASNVQRALCRVADGLPLGDLAADEIVVKAFGGQDAVDALDAMSRAHHGLGPKELYVVAAIRCGKSLLSAAIAVKIALTIDLTRLRLGKHDKARVSIISVDRDKAGAVMDHLRSATERDDGWLARYVVKKPKPRPDRVLLRRNDGKLVEIVVAAGRKGGSSLVSRWTVAAVFDEAARMQGQEDGVVNFDDSRKAVIARLGLIPGAMLVVVTSPWAARGPIYEAVDKNYGHPTIHRVVVCAPGPAMNPNTWTPEACEAERLRPDGAYETDVLGLFADPESGWLSAVAVNGNTRSAPAVRARPEGTLMYRYVAAMDPGVAGNAWTLVIAGVEADPSGDEMKDKYHVALCWQKQGRPSEPLRAREVFAEMAPTLKAFGISSVYSDRWSGHLLAEIGDLAGVAVDVSQDAPEQTSKNYSDFRTLLLDGRLELAPDPVFRADLLSVRKKLLPGGAIKYAPMLTRDGRHGDYAPAAVLAIARLRAAPDWVSAMRSARARGGSPFVG